LYIRNIIIIALPSLLNFNTDRYIRKAQECEIQALRNLVDNLKAVYINLFILYLLLLIIIIN